MNNRCQYANTCESTNEKISRYSHTLADSHRRSGFTLVETIVSISVFMIVVSIAIGNFARTLVIQRQLSSLISANSNASLALEQMMREVRTGYGFGCPNATTTIPGWGMGCTGFTVLTFVNALGQNVRYDRGTDVSGRGFIRRVAWVGGLAPAPVPITSNDVNIRYFTINLRGIVSTDGYPARVTILMGVSPVAQGIANTIQNFQTTISPREPDG